jgi:hypothetical protein
MARLPHRIAAPWDIETIRPFASSGLVLLVVGVGLVLWVLETLGDA